MAYNAIWDCAQDPDIRARIAACSEQEGVAPDGGERYAVQHALAIASRTDIQDAWKYSMEAAPWHSRRGYDTGIITDQMILSAVQALKPSP